MCKRSRDASFSPASDEIRVPLIKDSYGSDALAGCVPLPPAKYNQMSPDAESTFPIARVVQCSLAPHRETIFFSTQEEHEVHYCKEHTNRCSTCSKNFPSPRFLELHIEENHNALREELAVRGEKTYGCFVEDCDRKCSTPQKRRLHLIDKHMFPKTYNFRVIDQGIDKAVSMLREGRRRRVSTADDNRYGGRHRRQTSYQLQNPAVELREEKFNGISPGNDSRGGIAKPNSLTVEPPNQAATAQGSIEHLTDELDNITQSLSSLRFVPPSVLRNQNRMSARPQNS